MTGEQLETYNTFAPVCLPKIKWAIFSQQKLNVKVTLPVKKDTNSTL